jgi:hypothetical protein
MKMKFPVLFAGMLGFCNLIPRCSLYSQQVENGFELHELVKIGETYKNAINLSFDMSYAYSDSASPSSPLESLSGTYKIRNGKYWTMIDSIEFIQGQQFDIAVYYGDSTIVVNEQRDYGDILKIPALDTAFQKANIDSIQIIEYNDSTRLLTLFFNKDASYSLYKLQYDKTKYLIRKLEYYIRNMPDESGDSTITGLIALNLSNYSEQSVDPSLFQEDRIIYKASGELLPQVGFTNFKVYNNTITKQIPLNENNN